MEVGEGKKGGTKQVINHDRMQGTDATLRDWDTRAWMGGRRGMDEKLPHAPSQNPATNLTEPTERCKRLRLQ